MDQRELGYANTRLKQRDHRRSKPLFWIIIGIIFGIIIIVVIVLLWLMKSSVDNSSTYPYIPAPQNTIRSTSLNDLIANILLDTNESGVKYSVISKSDMIKGRI